MNTRKKTTHFLFGFPSPLPLSQLPTVGDVLRLIWHYRCNRERCLKTSHITWDVACDVADIWSRALGDRTTIPIISQNAIDIRLQRLYKTARDVLKYNSKEKLVNEFKTKMDTLFDI